MFIKSLILACLITVIYSPPARADSACQMIDRVLGTLSVVRKIQIDRSDTNYSENMSKLGVLVDQISLPTLFPPNTNNALQVEKEAFFYYLSNLREAVANANVEYHDYARQTLNKGIKSEFTDSILSLEYYWNCRVDGSSSEKETTTNAKHPSYLENPITTVKIFPVELPKPSVAKLNTVSRASKSGISKRVNFSFPSIHQGNSLLAPLLVILALFTLLYFALSRSKSFKVRENRRLLHIPVKTRIGKVDHTMEIVDISMNGIKILHSGVILKQHKLRIQLDGTWHLGQIKWSNDLFAGVKFNKPISNQTLDTVIQSTRRSTPPPHEPETLGTVD